MDKDFIKFIVVVIVLLVTCATFATIGVTTAGRITCNNTWEESGYAHRYQFSTGCMIRDTDGLWLPADVIRIIKPHRTLEQYNSSNKE